MIKYFALGITLMLMSHTTAVSQSIEADVIEWTADHLSDLRTNIDTTYHATFLTAAKEKIKWIQGDYIIEMTVRGSEGTWNDVSQDGSFKYKVSINDKQGTLVFSRLSGQVVVRMEFLEEMVNALPYEFRISNVTRVMQ